MKLKMLWFFLFLIGSISESKGVELVYLSSDEGGVSCNLEVSVGETASFYVLGWTDFPWGIVGAELRVVGVPQSWVVSVTPNPLAHLTLGDPLGEGANIAFPAPAGYGHAVILYTVVVTPTSQESDLEFSVTHKSPPTNANLVCPRLNYACPGPCDFFPCAEGRSLWVNSSQGCVVSVEASSWTMIKGLYQ